MNRRKQRFAPRKMAALLQYLCWQFRRKRSFTLDTILFLAFKCDQAAFVETGRSLTGATWHKTKTGVSF